ncbi:MAG: hypothetical protein ABIN79_11835 [Marmoricola sp.]
MFALLSLGLVGLHLGPLHRGEQALVYVLAFGPLVLLAFVVWRSRRRNPADTKVDDL